MKRRSGKVEQFCPETQGDSGPLKRMPVCSTGHLCCFNCSGVIISRKVLSLLDSPYSFEQIQIAVIIQ